MSLRLPHHVGRKLLLGAVAIAVPGIPVALAAPAVPDVPAPQLAVTAPALDEEPVPVPAGVERHVAGDMVVDWIGGAPEGFDETLTASGVPVDLTIAAHDDHDGHDHAGEAHAAASFGPHEGSQHHAAASGGYALFSNTARWLPSGYTIRLTGADGRIDQYRDELTEAARAATELTGVPIRIAPAFGGPVDPARGEIAVVLGAGPCGSGAVGCGGPALTQREVVSGRVWVHPSGLGLSPAQRTNLAAHELGHALGLQHFDGSWSDGRQVMFPTITGTTSYRAGDGAGLRRLAGADDRPAGKVTSRTYAAGLAHIAGTVSTGSRVRIAAGSVVADVAVRDGRFSGSIPLPAGAHHVCASSLDPAAGFRPDLGCATLHAPGAPVGTLDAAQDSATGIQVRGWAIDPQTADPVQVQIRRNGVLVATVRADEHRDDLGHLAHRYGTAHGFSATIPAEDGRNRVCVRVLGVGAGGDLDAGCADVDHTPPAQAVGTALIGGTSALDPASAIVGTVTSPAAVDEVVDAVVGTVAVPVAEELHDAILGG